MDSLPPELLAHIGSLLFYRDLCRFRLVSQRCAVSTFHLITRHLSLLNTSYSLDDFLSFIKPRSPFTRQLTIYHGEWVACSKAEWAIHPLLCHPIPPQYLFKKDSDAHPVIDLAYRNYKTFVATESRRNFETDAKRLDLVLSCLPNVRTLKLTHFGTWRHWHSENPKFSRLRKAIWIGPRLRGSVNHILQTFLAVSHRFQSIDELVIEGRLDLTHFDDPGLPTTFGTIRTLRITSTPEICERRQEFLGFIQSFPKLELLDLTLSAAAVLPLEGLRCSRLHTLCLTNIWSSEETLLKIIEINPQLRTITLISITLSGGTWHSFYNRLNRVERRVSVLAGG